MFRSPSEPSPFASTRCPYDTQARCGRPYCPFAHRAETVDVVEDTANDVLVLDSDHLSDGGRSSVGTEIRQENPTEHFSGCYMGYVSTTNPTTTTNDVHLPPMFPTSAAIPQPPQMQQHQQNGQQHLFFPNFPPMHQHQQPISALPQFGPSSIAVPAHYVQSCPFVPAYPSYPPQQQFSEPIMYSHPPVPLATVSTTMAPSFPSAAAAAVQPQTVAPSAVKQHRSSHKRPKTAAGPGGLPAYIPTPIAQLEKEQRERERRREERRVRKEDGQPKKGKEHATEKQSDDGKAARQREQMGQQNDRGRRESVGEGENAHSGGGAATSSRETEKEREVPTSTADSAAGGGLNIDRIMDDQKQLLNEMSDDREKKIREILRVEAEHERRVHMAKQKTASKKFILSNKTTVGGGPAKSPSKLTKMKKTIDKKKAAATLKKKKLLTTKNGAEGEKKEKHNTVIKELVDEKRKHQKQKEEKEQMEKKKKEKEEEEERNKKKKQKQTAVNNCVKQVAELDKEIAKIQSELQRSSNKMANLHTGKMSTPAKKASATNSIPTVLQNTVAHKTGEQKMKKIPVWRKDSEQLSRPCTFLEDTRFYLATQRHPIPAALRRDGTAAKSVDSIVNDLFGDDIEEGTNLAGKAKLKKQRSASTAAAAANEMPPVDNPKKLLHLATKREKQRHKSPKRRNAEHDHDVGGADFDDLQRERQAMIDSIIEDENLENDHHHHHQPMHQAKGNDGTAKGGEAKRKSPPPPPQKAHSKKRRLSRSPSIVTLRSSSASSSVSVVPETPQASPSRDNYVPARDNYVPSRVPMHHPSQRPTAPKPFTAKSSSNSSSSVAVTTASRPSVSSSTFVVAAAATSASGSATHHQQHQPQKKQHQETQQHNANTAAKTKPATVAKGTVRKAHVPKFQSANPSTSTAKLLVPLEPLNRKVPLQLRQRHLTTIYAEYAKICGDDPSRAIEGAQNEEKSVLDRCNGKMGYLAAIPMLIKRLRDAAADGHSHDEGETRRRDSVSHTSVLLGRHAKTVTCGLHRAERSSLTAQHTNFTEADFYNALQDGYLLTDQQMWDNGYPRWAETSAAGDKAMEEEGQGLDTDDPNAGKRRVEIRQSELDAGKSRIPFVDDSVLSRVCDRCGKEYRLTKEGDYAAGASSDQCIFHWGRAWKKRVSGTVESRYNCCDQPLTVQGCDVAPHHITQTQRLSTLRCYAETPRPFGVGDPRSKKVYALDCEMVYTVWGPEVARLSVVDITGDLILDVIIRPEHRIVDCNTKFSGLKPEQVMAGECDLNEAHQRFFELVNTETILLGHSLESDLRAMHLVHRRVVDTSVVFPHRMGPPYKRALKTLAAELTQMIIQDDESGHDSKEDALACMRIMLRKCRGGAGAP